MSKLIGFFLAWAINSYSLAVIIEHPVVARLFNGCFMISIPDHGLRYQTTTLILVLINTYFSKWQIPYSWLWGRGWVGGVGGCLKMPAWHPVNLLLSDLFPVATLRGCLSSLYHHSCILMQWYTVSTISYPVSSVDTYGYLAALWCLNKGEWWMVWNLQSVVKFCWLWWTRSGYSSSEQREVEGE